MHYNTLIRRRPYANANTPLGWGSLIRQRKYINSSLIRINRVVTDLIGEDIKVAQET